MQNGLVIMIRQQTETLFANIEIMLKTCDLNYILCDMPVWKHAYHTLHSCDQWYINPNRYTEPDFHVPGLNSLDMQSDIPLSRDDLTAYFATIRGKIFVYLDTLTDDMLYTAPPGCKHSRMTLILAQFRHMYAHLGMINATTIMETGQWPRVIGLDGNTDALSPQLFE